MLESRSRFYDPTNPWRHRSIHQASRTLRLSCIPVLSYRYHESRCGRASHGSELLETPFAIVSGCASGYKICSFIDTKSVQVGLPALVLLDLAYRADTCLSYRASHPEHSDTSVEDIPATVCLNSREMVVKVRSDVPIEQCPKTDRSSSH